MTAWARARTTKGVRPSFRALVGLLALLLIVSILTTIALFSEGSVAKEAIAEVENDALVIPTCEALTANLLSYDRLSSVQGTDRTATTEAIRQDTRRSVLRQVASLEHLADDPGERKAVAQLRARVQASLDAANRASPEPGGAGSRSATALTGALESVAAFRSHDVEQIRLARARATRLTTFADVGRVVVVGALLLEIATLLAAVQWGLGRPVTALKDAMDRFSHGEPNVRVTPGGAAELVSIGESFNHMADVLEDRRATQVRFVAAIAHDLRNPLTVLKLVTDNRARRSHGAPQRGDPAWKLVGRQVEHLDRMVGDLLDTARIEHGELDLARRPTDLRDLIRESVALFRNQSVQHQIELEVPSEPVVAQCDPLRLEQVLNNLLSNAIKYSPGGGTVHVRLRERGDLASITVTDHGVGIDPDERRYVFEPFGRAPSTREAAPGVGLGLSAARRIVAAHGGTLDFDSVPGVATTFELLLPLVQDATTASALPTAPSSTQAPPI
ncbi:MAG: HAMP domain-containing histidine kinase [Deltaproteobacteria bacterium]|nr:HAMP domain-containing histidine kinase [Deltaproteobacteria bacterium]